MGAWIIGVCHSLLGRNGVGRCCGASLDSAKHSGGNRLRFPVEVDLDSKIEFGKFGGAVSMHLYWPEMKGQAARVPEFGGQSGCVEIEGNGGLYTYHCQSINDLLPPSPPFPPLRSRHTTQHPRPLYSIPPPPPRPPRGAARLGPLPPTMKASQSHPQP